MSSIRRAAALGAAGLAAAVLGGAGTAFAWAPGSVTLGASCKGEPGSIVLTVGNTDPHDGEFVITGDKSTDSFKGSVKAHGSTEVTVPYQGAGTTWTLKLTNVGKEDVHASVTTVNEPKCLPVKPSPSPSPSASHSVAPSPPATPPTATPAPKAGTLAFTGANVVAVGGGAAALAAAGGGALLWARRAGRRSA